MIEQVADQVVLLEYINTHDHPADIGTKPLGPAQFEHLRNFVMGPQRSTGGSLG